MSGFKREERYLVLKWDDISLFLSDDDQNRVDRMCKKIAYERNLKGKRADSFVCVADDWPEYELVWAMIEARMTGKPNTIAQQAERIKDVEQDREHYALDNLNLTEQLAVANASLASTDALIEQAREALHSCNINDGLSGPMQYYDEPKVDAALAAIEAHKKGEKPTAA